MADVSHQAGVGGHDKGQRIWHAEKKKMVMMMMMMCSCWLRRQRRTDACFSLSLLTSVSSHWTDGNVLSNTRTNQIAAGQQPNAAGDRKAVIFPSPATFLYEQFDVTGNAFICCLARG